MATAGSTRDRELHEHVVQFYGDGPSELVPTLAEFLGSGIDAGGAAVVITSPATRAALRATLDGAGAARSDHVVWLDAAGTLARFMVGDLPDRDLFFDVVGAVVRKAAAGGRDVRAYGDMVALLWAEGNVAAALALEELWNELGSRQAFSLFCGYPLASVAGTGDLAAFGAVCAQHHEIVPAATAGHRVVGTGDAPDIERSMVFVPTLRTAKAARRFVQDTLAAWGLEALRWEAQLLASELSTNAIVHAESPFRLSLSRQAAGVRIGVTDSSATLPLARDAAADATTGRGMELVAGLASSWGCETVAGTKTVWAQLAIGAR